MRSFGSHPKHVKILIQIYCIFSCVWGSSSNAFGSNELEHSVQRIVRKFSASLSPSLLSSLAFAPKIINFDCRSAIASLGPNGGTVIIPENSTCTLSSVLNIQTSNVTLRGGGRNAVIHMTAPGGFLKIVPTSTGFPVSNVTLDDLVIESDQSRSIVYAQNISNLVIEGVTFIGGGPQIYLNKVSGFTLSDNDHMGEINTNNVISVLLSTNGVIEQTSVEGYKDQAGFLSDVVDVRYSKEIQVSNLSISTSEGNVVANAEKTVNFNTSSHCNFQALERGE